MPKPHRARFADYTALIEIQNGVAADLILCMTTTRAAFSSTRQSSRCPKKSSTIGTLCVMPDYFSEAEENY